jgi:hypothetical protein|tara:strand:+ start:519 stop:788 length:270 start_codon:yes stop_codon:yes gene_type:complete
MYGNQKTTQESQSSDKNPNRVTGGLKGQGVDHVVMVSENGLENKIPTQRYVQSLEDQLRKQRAAITVIDRKLMRVETSVGTLQARKSYD